MCVCVRVCASLLIFVEDELCLILLGLVNCDTSEQGLRQFFVLSSLDDETNLHVHERTSRREHEDGLLGQVRKLVDVDVHLQVVRSAYDGARAANEHRLGVVRANRRRNAKLVKIAAGSNHLEAASPRGVDWSLLAPLREQFHGRRRCRNVLQLIARVL